jgi:hypothetical protein
LSAPQASVFSNLFISWWTKPIFFWYMIALIFC